MRCPRVVVDPASASACRVRPGVNWSLTDHACCARAVARVRPARLRWPLCAQTQDLVLFKMEPPPEPWSPPDNLWMYWGQAPNKRFGHSGDNVRHLVKMGRLGGGEYRDPHFLFDFASQTFRDLSESCCTAMLVYRQLHTFVHECTS